MTTTLTFIVLETTIVDQVITIREVPKYIKVVL